MCINSFNGSGLLRCKPESKLEKNYSKVVKRQNLLRMFKNEKYGILIKDIDNENNLRNVIKFLEESKGAGTVCLVDGVFIYLDKNGNFINCEKRIGIDQIKFFRSDEIPFIKEKPKKEKLTCPYSNHLHILSEVMKVALDAIKIKEALQVSSPLTKHEIASLKYYLRNYSSDGIEDVLLWKKLEYQEKKLINKI